MKGITNLAALVDEARRHDDLLEIARPADPYLEIAAVARATDAGPVTLFNNVTGHPGRRVISNIFGSRARVARLCKVDPAYLPRYLADAALNPIRVACGLRSAVPADRDRLRASTFSRRSR